MATAMTVLVFVVVFLLLLGFFPLIYYVVSMIYRRLTMRRQERDMPPGDYDLAKLREVKEQRIRI